MQVAEAKRRLVGVPTGSYHVACGGLSNALAHQFVVVVEKATDRDIFREAYSLISTIAFLSARISDDYQVSLDVDSLRGTLNPKPLVVE